MVIRWAYGKLVDLHVPSVPWQGSQGPERFLTVSGGSAVDVLSPSMMLIDWTEKSSASLSRVALMDVMAKWSDDGWYTACVRVVRPEDCNTVKAYLPASFSSGCEVNVMDKTGWQVCDAPVVLISDDSHWHICLRSRTMSGFYFRLEAT